MSSSGKQKRKKYRQIAIEEILPNAVVRPSTTSWAEEVEDELHLSEYALKKINSINLPKAPRAARDLVIDETKIPPNGPFRAFMSNLPFETTEEDVTALFGQLKIEKVELPRDRQDRMKGFGYIEFRDKSSLLVALQEGELTLKSRLVRISLPTDDDGKGGSRGNTSFTRNRDMSDRFDRSDKPMEWRAAAPIPHDPDKSAPKHSGGFTRQNFRERESSSGGGGPFRESRSGFSSDFDRSSSFSRVFRDRDGDDRTSDRGGSRPFTKRFGGDRDDRGVSRSTLFGKKFERNDREREFKRDDREREFKRDDREREFKRDDREREFKRDDREREFKREPAPEREEPKTRPRIELQPRSKPLDTNPAPSALPSSIFGSAKPVDTARREQEIELKLESAPVPRNRPASPMSDATPNRSRSSSVSSVSSIRRQQPDSTETAKEPTRSSLADNESEKPKTVEFKEPAPPPPTNVWQKRSEENAAAAAAVKAAEKISSNVVDSTVIDDTSNAEESPDQSEGTSPRSPAEESSLPDENVDKADSETSDRAASEKPRDQPPVWTTWSKDSYDLDQPASSGGGGRYIGGSRYDSSNSTNNSFSNSSNNANKYSSFNRDNRRERRDNRRGDSDRRPDSDRRSDMDRRGGERRLESSRVFNKRDDNYGGNRSESGPFGGPRAQNRDSHFRNRNGTGRRDDRGGNFSSSRDKNDYSSAASASLRSSSSSISNLRDESEKFEERKVTSDERLTANDAETCNDARAQTKSPFEEQPQQPEQQNVDERLQSTTATSNEKPLENGDESGALNNEPPSVTHSDAAPTSAVQSDLNDISFSSSKSRKKSLKKKMDKSDNAAAADKDILKPIENDRKQNNQKDDKKKASDSQENDKTTNNNNAKGKEGNRSKKAVKKSRDIQDASQPKQKEEKAPNFQGSNRYQLLDDDS